MSPRIDLHAHTVHSDGTLTPAALVEHAAEIGLHALAVTDHDTTDGLAEARRTGAAVGVEVLDGCEITASVPSGIAHVLAYAFDPRHRALQDLLERVRAGRDERNRRILGKLAELGVPVEEEAVRSFAVGAVVARPHFAQALLACGHIDTLRQAFERYLSDRGPAYVRAEVPPARDALRAVIEAGGVAVLAHPRSLRLGSRHAYRQILGELRRAGLGGLEVDHPSQDPNQRRMFGDLADELDLVRTGGSDFHGEVKPHIALGSGNGTIDVRYATWERLRARAGEGA